MKRNWCWTYFLFYILLIWGCVRTQRTPPLPTGLISDYYCLLKDLAIPCVCDATVGRRVSHVGMEQRTRQHPISILTERFHIASVIRVTSPASVTTGRVAVLRKKNWTSIKIATKRFLSCFRYSVQWGELHMKSSKCWHVTKSHSFYYCHHHHHHHHHHYCYYYDYKY